MILYPLTERETLAVKAVIAALWIGSIVSLAVLTGCL